MINIMFTHLPMDKKLVLKLTHTYIVIYVFVGRGFIVLYKSAVAIFLLVQISIIGGA